MREQRLKTTHALLAACVVLACCGSAVAGSADFLTVSSRYNCCLNSAASATIPPGVSTITYISGAWSNNPSGAFLGYVRVEVPALGLVFPLGTDEQVGFSRYADAEAAAIGDSEIIQNDSGDSVTAYFHVWDSCNSGGLCADNAGDVVVDITTETVANESRSWSAVKAQYR